MQRVVIAGATGYLGQHLVDVYSRNGWIVRALVRDKARAKTLSANELFEGKATQPNTLIGLMDDVDLVVSSLGITRQKDGFTYREVDYQANRNLLDLAIENGVPQFGYVHVLNAHLLSQVELVQAKQDFVDLLNAYPIKSTVIAPSGYFSDLENFLRMAQRGRIYLFGNGNKRINPIHGTDLAETCFEVIEAGAAFAEVGGPQTNQSERIWLRSRSKASGDLLKLLISHYGLATSFNELQKPVPNHKPMVLYNLFLVFCATIWSGNLMVNTNYQSIFPSYLPRKVRDNKKRSWLIRPSSFLNNLFILLLI